MIQLICIFKVPKVNKFIMSNDYIPLMFQLFMFLMTYIWLGSLSYENTFYLQNNSNLSFKTIYL